MSDTAHDIHRLYFATTTIVHAVVATSHEKACAIADEAVESNLVDSDSILRSDVTAVLATSLPDGATGAETPQWEYAYEPDSDDEDTRAESSLSTRRWVIVRWITEQRHLAPRAVEAPAVVSVNDDWRGPPSPEEVRAHHAAHATRHGASVWHMIAGGECAVAVIARDGALYFGPHESTRWRPADALHTPVAWSTPRGAR